MEEFGSPATDFLRRGAGRLAGRDGLMHPRVRVAAMLVAMVMGVLSLERLAILLAMPERFDAVGAGSLLRGFLTGLRFDAVIACILVAPALVGLLPAPPGLLAKRGFQWVLSAYGGLAVALVFLACVADFFFFQEFGHRLDHKVLTYSGYDYVRLIIVDQFPLVPAVAATVVVFLVGMAGIRRFGFGRERPGGSLLDGFLWSGLIVCLVGLGIRGSVGRKAINSGPAYFSSSPALAQLALNGCFTLREAIITLAWRTAAPAEYYEVPPDDEAFRIARRTVAGTHDRFVDDPQNPLRRVTVTGRPRQDHNVVVVILEGFGWRYIGALGGVPGLTPNLDELAEHGILMDRCFAVGGRTTRGVCGIVSGFPDLLGDSVSTRSTTVGSFLTLGSVLGRRGYQTLFVYGGQPHYDHRQSFLVSNGYDRFISGAELPSRTFRTHMGWCDGDLFRSTDAILRETDKPFLATLLTLSFHRPYEIPPGEFDGGEAANDLQAKQRNVVRYVDWAVGRFIDEARTASYFDNTLFVFVADSPGGYLSPEQRPEDFRVPFLIYAPGILGMQGQRISTVCSQTDVAPTILSLLGGSYEHCFFGSDVLQRDPPDGFALIQAGHNLLYFVDGQGRVEILMPFARQAHLFQMEAPDGLVPIEAAEQNRALRRKATGILQAAYLLYQRGAYRLRQEPSAPSDRP